jgi:serine/threonine protein kinase
MKIYEENGSNITKIDIKNQINILKKLSHPQIIKLYQVFYYSNKMYLIYEYCPDGNLFEYITKIGKINENKCRQIIHQIITGLNYCHLNKIILCNLSPEHIVVHNKTNKNSLWLKII